jgi:hypothetical protein
VYDSALSWARTLAAPPASAVRHTNAARHFIVDPGALRTFAGIIDYCGAWNIGPCAAGRRAAASPSAGEGELQLSHLLACLVKSNNRRDVPVGAHPIEHDLQLPVGTIPTFSTIRITQRSGARVR